MITGTGLRKLIESFNMGTTSARETLENKFFIVPEREKPITRKTPPNLTSASTCRISN